MKSREKIAIVIPYFGKLPNWFQLFLLSASNTKMIKFFLITDDKTPFQYPSNFIVDYKSFSEIQCLFKEKLNSQNIYLSHPYKLCDYKPCYGVVFSEYIKGFEYWGHCDIDLIFGDIDYFLSKINIFLYDRLFLYGHFSLYKNVDYVNNSFRLKVKEKAPKFFDFDFISRTTFPCNFDEVGINYVLRSHGFSFYEKNHCANVHLNYRNFRLGDGFFRGNSIIIYQNGKIFEVKSENVLQKFEFFYVHLMSRGYISVDLEIKNDFLISQDGFLPLKEGQISSYLEQFGGEESQQQQQEYLNLLLKKHKRDIKLKIKRELIYNGFKIIPFIIHRYKLKKWLIENQ